MFILFLILAVFQDYGASVPIVTNIIDTRDAQQNHKTRTHFDIVRSCVSTLIICMSVAIHPNIPPRGERPIRSLLRRVKLVLWTLLMPELVLIWAYKQWSAARYIAEYFQDEGWTPIHGHFLIMGGFVYVDEEGEKVLDFKEFRKLLGQHQIAFPMITTAEICDKAGGDFLSKAIAALQGLWFILQCIARGKQGLALTELEVVTVALTSFNAVMYFFWSDKPLHIEEPVWLYREGHDPQKKFIGIEESGEHDRREQRIRDSSKRSLFQRFIDIVSPIQSLLKDSCTVFASLCSAIYRQLSSISTSDVNKFLNHQRNRLDNDIPGVNYLWFLYLPIYWFIWIPVTAFGQVLFAIVSTEHLYTFHVPTFYAPTLSHDSGGLLLPVLLLTMIFFGALHCTGWNFHFPSHAEQLLWRFGSLAITLLPIIPLSVLTLVAIISLIQKRYSISKFETIWSSNTVQEILVFIGIFLAGASLIAYMAARLLLLMLAIVLLRRQPESAFYAIEWANFLPHIS